MTPYQGGLWNKLGDYWTTAPDIDPTPGRHTSLRNMAERGKIETMTSGGRRYFRLPQPRVNNYSTSQARFKVASASKNKLPILYADDCPPCEMCGEPWCVECNMHYADCAHPGPMSEMNDEDEDDD